MSAHEKYTRHQVAGLRPADVAQLANAKKSKGSPISVAELHRLVVEHGDADTRARWLDLLADAADPKWRGEGWPAMWAGCLLPLLSDPGLEPGLEESGQTELRVAS